MKQKALYLILIFFLGDILYLSYQLPQIIINGKPFPDDIQNLMFAAAICMPLLFLLKEKSNTSDTPEDGDDSKG